MTIYKEVKELVDVPTAFRHYGIEVRRSNTNKIYINPQKRRIGV